MTIQFKAITPDPLQKSLDVVRLPHPDGRPSLAVALPFGISRTLSATEIEQGVWLWEVKDKPIIGDEEHVIQVLANALTAEIIAAESKRSTAT